MAAAAASAAAAAAAATVAKTVRALPPNVGLTTAARAISGSWTRAVGAVCASDTCCLGGWCLTSRGADKVGYAAAVASGQSNVVEPPPIVEPMCSWPPNARAEEDPEVAVPWQDPTLPTPAIPRICERLAIASTSYSISEVWQSLPADKVPLGAHVATLCTFLAHPPVFRDPLWESGVIAALDGAAKTWKRDNAAGKWPSAYELAVMLCAADAVDQKPMILRISHALMAPSMAPALSTIDTDIVPALFAAVCKLPDRSNLASSLRATLFERVAKVLHQLAPEVAASCLLYGSSCARSIIGTDALLNKLYNAAEMDLDTVLDAVPTDMLYQLTHVLHYDSQMPTQTSAGRMFQRSLEKCRSLRQAFDTTELLSLSALSESPELSTPFLTQLTQATEPLDPSALPRLLALGVAMRVPNHAWWSQAISRISIDGLSEQPNLAADITVELLRSQEGRFLSNVRFRDTGVMVTSLLSICAMSFDKLTAGRRSELLGKLQTTGVRHVGLIEAAKATVLADITAHRPRGIASLIYLLAVSDAATPAVYNKLIAHVMNRWADFTPSHLSLIGWSCAVARYSAPDFMRRLMQDAISWTYRNPPLQVSARSRLFITYLELRNLGVQLPDSVRNCAEHHWRGSLHRDNVVSNFERSVIQKLRNFGYAIEPEYETPLGYVVDGAILADKIAIEVDGPLHFFQPAGGLTLAPESYNPEEHARPTYRMRRRHLEADGWRIVTITQYIWKQVMQDPSGIRRLLYPPTAAAPSTSDVVSV